ncbi:MAG TPA: hypothetical protein VNQ79_25835 [Blastocatellia bacterium]|nr:hypothetical protein [Blastocatellia bacterium]
MKGPVRLQAVAILLCLCPVLQADPVRLLPEVDWAALDQAQLQQFRENYLLVALDERSVIEAEGLPAAERDSSFARALWFYSGTPERLFLNLIRLGSPASPVAAPADLTETVGANSYFTGSAPGFYRAEVWQARTASRMVVPLDVMLPLLGGPLLFDTLSDPYSRFAVQPGIDVESQVALPAIAAGQDGGAARSFRDWIGLAELPEKALLVLLGFSLALLPALFRVLRALAGLLPALPARLGNVLALLRRPVYAPQQIEPDRNEAVNIMPKPRRVAVKRDKSWRRRPPGAGADAEAQNIKPEPAAEAATQADAPVAAELLQATGSGRTRIYRLHPPAAVRKEGRRSAETSAFPRASEALERESAGSLPRPEMIATGEEAGRERHWLTDDEEQNLITRVESDPAQAAPPSEPEVSFRDLRTGVMLAWLEERVPALTEAVAWEEEHLGEYRGLPFAEFVPDERRTEAGQRKTS